MNPDKIGKFIYEQRKKLNLTQSELADKLQITSQAVSKWENARGIPDIEMLNKLSEIFNVDIKDIINGEEQTNYQQQKNKKKKIYIPGGIILLLILISLLSITNQKEEDFNFHPITSDNSCFGLKGVIAYNTNKKSIYISDIECSNEQVKEFLDIECILYESIDNTDKKIYEYGHLSNYESYNKENLYTLNELLSNIEFNIDNYDCACNASDCNNIHIRINALNIDNEIITYDIPIELENKCIN